MPLSSLAVQQPTQQRNPFGLVLACIVGVVLLLAAGGWWWMDTQRSAEAEELLAKATDLANNDQPQAALSIINQGMAIKSTYGLLSLKARILTNSDRPNEAAATWDQLLKLSPNDAEAHSRRGLLAYNMSEYDIAIAQTRRANELEPDNASYALDLASLYMRLDQQGKAIPIYESLIRKDPNLVSAWQQYVYALSNNNRETDALAVARRAVTHNAKNSYYQLLLAQTCDALNDNPCAVRAYTRSLELDPMRNSIAAERILALTGHRPPPALEGMATNRIDYESHGKLMLVEAFVNGKAGRFLVDTGASICVLYKRAIPKFNLQMSPLQQTLEFSTANGRLQSSIGYAELSLGKFIFRNIAFATMPDDPGIPFDGIIGMNVLEHLQWEVDQNRHEMILKH